MKPVNRTSRWVGVVVLAAAILAGCGGSGTAGGAPGSKGASTDPSKDATEIVLGAVFPLTGKETNIGQGFKLASELAVKEFNDAGGIKIGDRKLMINLITQDDKTDATNSAQLIEQLVTDKHVHAIIGGYRTDLVSAQVAIPERYGIPYVNGGGAATAIYGHSKWVFGSLAPVNNLAMTQMEFLKAQIDADKLTKPLSIYVAWENTDHGKDYLDGVKESVKKYPAYFSLKGDEGFQLDASDFGPLLTKVKGANADVFMCDAHTPDFLLMHKQYLQMGLKHKMITYGARGSESAAYKAMADGVNYIFASNWWTNQLTDATNKAFVEKWQKAYNAKPEWWHAISYEGARALLKGIEAAGSLDPEKIRQALVNLDLKDSILPGGELKFSQTGQAIYPFVVTQNKPGGKVDIVFPQGNATGPAVAPIP